MGHPTPPGPDFPPDWPFEGYPDPFATDECGTRSCDREYRAEHRDCAGRANGHHCQQSPVTSSPAAGIDSDYPERSHEAPSPEAVSRSSWTFVHVLLVVVEATAAPGAIATSRGVCSQLCDRADTVIDRCQPIDSTTDAPSHLVGTQLQALPPACPLASPLGQRVFERIVSQTTGAQDAPSRDDDSLTANPDALPVVATVHDTLLYDETGAGIRSFERFRQVRRDTTAPVWLVPVLPFMVMKPAN